LKTNLKKYYTIYIIVYILLVFDYYYKLLKKYLHKINKTFIIPSTLLLDKSHRSYFFYKMYKCIFIYLQTYYSIDRLQYFNVIIFSTWYILTLVGINTTNLLVYKFKLYHIDILCKIMQDRIFKQTFLITNIMSIHTII